MKKIFLTKIGNSEIDLKLTRSLVSIGGLAFFMIALKRLSSLDISEFQLLMGITSAGIFMLLTLIASYLIPGKK